MNRESILSQHSMRGSDGTRTRDLLREGQGRLQFALRLTKYSVHTRRLQTTVHLSPSSYIKRLTARNSLSTTRSETRFAMS